MGCASSKGAAARESSKSRFAVGEALVSKEQETGLILRTVTLKDDPNVRSILKKQSTKASDRHNSRSGAQDGLTGSKVVRRRVTIQATFDTEHPFEHSKPCEAIWAAEPTSLTSSVSTLHNYAMHSRTSSETLSEGFDSPRASQTKQGVCEHGGGRNGNEELCPSSPDSLGLRAKSTAMLSIPGRSSRNLQFTGAVDAEEINDVIGDNPPERLSLSALPGSVERTSAHKGAKAAIGSKHYR